MNVVELNWQYASPTWGRGGGFSVCTSDYYLLPFILKKRSPRSGEDYFITKVMKSNENKAYVNAPDNARWVDQQSGICLSQRASLPA